MQEHLGAEWIITHDLTSHAQELRERAYAALERLCAHAAEEQGPLDDRLHALPLHGFADAAECLYELGWVAPTSD